MLAIGDIHGCFQALLTLARTVPFRSDDLLVGLGDYVDRGPNSRGVLDWLIARARGGGLVALRGNHEIMMLDARWDPLRSQVWVDCGGGATLASYPPSAPGEDPLSRIPVDHWRFLEEGTRPWFETGSHFFVHANAYPDYPIADQPDFMLFWEKFDDPPPHQSGKVMVCGHTPQKSGVPRNLGHAVCIDTWAYGGGWLTALDVASGDYWQANERGESRRGRLETPAG